MTDQLLKRIENLERQNKRMRVILSGLCLCLGGLLTMGYVLPQKTESRMERIEAREIVLSDGDDERQTHSPVAYLQRQIRA